MTTDPNYCKACHFIDPESPGTNFNLCTLNYTYPRSEEATRRAIKATNVSAVCRFNPWRAELNTPLRKGVH